VCNAPKLSLVFQDVRLIDPSTNRDERADVVVVEGLVADIRAANTYKGKGDQTIPVLSCSGRWLVPGLVDIHVHLREP
jgi:dihydroorotase